MTKFLLIVICVLTVLFALAMLAIYIQGKIYKGKLQRKEAEIISMWNETQEKQKEILDNAKQKKDSLHTGDNDGDFKRSVDILQDISRRGC